MCTRFHLEVDREGVGEMVAAVAGSRLAGRFLKAGKALRTEGDARPTDVVAVVAPVLSFVLKKYMPEWTGYNFGFEILLINGLLTFLGLLAISGKRPVKDVSE